MRLIHGTKKREFHFMLIFNMSCSQSWFFIVYLGYCDGEHS